MKSFGTESLLLPTYFLMLVVFGCLNFIGRRNFDIVSITVNLGMFLIVGFVFIWSIYTCFRPVSRMAANLRYTIQTMEIDFDKTQSYLWETYRNENSLFTNTTLSKRYNEFRIERKRLNMLSQGGRCDIEDYINEQLIDSQIKKGIVSIVPGVMTGLGILGAFIGLSFGLQNFNTGSAAQITNSIAPLMDGIKVAFHTSIYGMVFSLVYNFVYKKTLEDAYQAIDEFLEAFYKYVLPKTMNNDMALFIDFQEKQLQEIANLLDDFGTGLAHKIAVAMQSPQDMSAYDTQSRPVYEPQNTYDSADWSGR